MMRSPCCYAPVEGDIVVEDGRTFLENPWCSKCIGDVQPDSIVDNTGGKA